MCGIRWKVVVIGISGSLFGFGGLFGGVFVFCVGEFLMYKI